MQLTRRIYIISATTLFSIIITIVLWFNFFYKTSDNTSKYNSKIDDEFGNITKFNNHDSINQWYLLNNGNLNTFVNDFFSWENDKKYAVPGVDINIDLIDNVFIQNRSTQIALIDADIDISNTSLNNKIWINNDEVPNDNIDNDNNRYVDDINGWNFCDNNNKLFNIKDAGIHGTHIAGILFGSDDTINFSGILTDYDISYMCLKVLHGKNEFGKIDYIIDAIKYAEENGAKICCMSLATRIYSEELKNVMSESNMLFVVASGNYGKDIDKEQKTYPACFDLDNIITVADIRCDGKLSLISNYGESSVDIAAPGTDIISIIPNNEYAYLSGTSCATAMVAGEAALIYCCCPSILTSHQIKDIIIQNSTYSTLLNHKVLCSGYINVFDALSESLRY